MDERLTTPIPVRIDAHLNGKDAWAVTDAPASSFSFDTTTPLVQLLEDKNHGLMIAITRAAPSEERERVEIWLLESDHALRAEVEAFWYGHSSSIPNRLKNPYGSITLDAGHLPTADEVRVIEWDIGGIHDEEVVHLRGKVRLTARDLKR